MSLGIFIRIAPKPLIFVKSSSNESPMAKFPLRCSNGEVSVATLGLDAFRRSSRYQENNSVNQQCHAGHYPKRGECVAYLGLRLPSLVPSCYVRHVVCSPARYKSHTPHYIAREWADLPFFFCIRAGRKPRCTHRSSNCAAELLPWLVFRHLIHQFVRSICYGT